MKKLTLLVAALGFSVAAQAAAPALPLGITALGYDDNLKHVTARLGLSENNALDVGVGLNYNDAVATDKFQLGLSGFYLLKLQDWGMVDNHFVAGAYMTIFSDSDLDLKVFAGLQPELTLMERLVVSVRFGGELAVSPDIALQTKGQPISVVQGLNFKVLW